MKGVTGAILFIIGLSMLIDGGVWYGKVGNSPWWFLVLGFIMLGLGLELIIDSKIDSAKKELREELENKR